MAGDDRGDKSLTPVGGELGYMICGTILDNNFALTKQLLVDSKYLSDARTNGVACRFTIRWADSGNKTTEQLAYVIAMYAYGTTADVAHIEFVAIDPPSWFLNVGDASGKVYTGTVSDVISQCVSEYASALTLEISDTIGSDQSQFGMMRMDPKTFIMSLLDWSAPLTQKKTRWLVSMDGLSLQIKEQADIVSYNVGFYPGAGSTQTQAIVNWELLANNFLSIAGSKLVTFGASSSSGEFIDRVTDGVAQQFVYVKDGTTENKYKARTTRDGSFAAPADGGPSSLVGWSSVQPVPEIYSGGEIGLKYSQYMDGRARKLWLELSESVLRCRLRVAGHGVYSSSYGLGVNSITVQWFDSLQKPFLLSGNWMLYGFEHLFDVGVWYTDLYCFRLDFDAAGVKVPLLPF